jgi:hypothetical protein
MGFRREPEALIGADDLQGSDGDQAVQGRHGGARSVRSAGGPLVTRTAKTRVAASCRRVEAQPFTGSESTAPVSTQMSTGNEYPNEPFTRWQRQRTRLVHRTRNSFRFGVGEDLIG